MSDESVCYCLDLDDDPNWNNIEIVDKNKLPKNYLPSRDSFFEEIDCHSFSVIQEYVKAKMSRKCA